MAESTPQKKGAGKAGRVSHRRELAVVTLAAVASISGVAGLLAGQQSGAPAQSANAPGSALASHVRPKPVHNRTLALAPASYRGDDGEEAGEDGGVVFRSANKVGTARQNGNAVHAPAPHARPSTVSRGSAPVN